MTNGVYEDDRGTGIEVDSPGDERLTEYRRLRSKLREFENYYMVVVTHCFDYDYSGQRNHLVEMMKLLGFDFIEDSGGGMESDEFTTFYFDRAVLVLHYLRLRDPYGNDGGELLQLKKVRLGEYARKGD